MFGDVQTSIPEGAAINAAWVSPGGYTWTWAAAAEPEHGGIPGSVTASDE